MKMGKVRAKVLNEIVNMFSDGTIVNYSAHCHYRHRLPAAMGSATFTFRRQLIDNTGSIIQSYGLDVLKQLYTSGMHFFAPCRG
jgi:hypothetical protein